MYGCICMYIPLYASSVGILLFSLFLHFVLYFVYFLLFSASPLSVKMDAEGVCDCSVLLPRYIHVLHVHGVLDVCAGCLL